MTAVWAHTLAGSDAIARVAPRVEAEVLRLLGQPRSQVDLNVDPGSGWISALARDQRTRRRPALVPAKEARRRAEAFVRELASKLKPGPDLPMAFVPPLPGDPLELASVPHRHAPEWNHWLYRTQPRLPTSRGGAAAPVLGAALEIRIGDGGRIVGFHSRWRPTTGERLPCEATAMPADDDGAQGGHDAQGGHGTAHEHASGTEHGPAATPSRGKRVPRRVYVLDGAAVPQPYLALYHLLDAGHHFRLASACSLALLVELEVDDTEDRTTVRAVTNGGSGHYRYSWARMSAADPFDGIEVLGRGTIARDRDRGATSTIVLRKAFHQVMVHVVDTETGAFKHHQQHVVSSPFSKRQEAPFALPDPARTIVQVHDPDDPVA